MDEMLAVLIGMIVRLGTPIAVLTLIVVLHSRHQKRHVH